MIAAGAAAEEVIDFVAAIWRAFCHRKGRDRPEKDWPTVSVLIESLRPPGGAGGGGA